MFGSIVYALCALAASQPMTIEYYTTKNTHSKFYRKFLFHSYLSAELSERFMLCGRHVGPIGIFWMIVICAWSVFTFCVTSIDFSIMHSENVNIGSFGSSNFGYTFIFGLFWLHTTSHRWEGDGVRLCVQRMAARISRSIEYV